jgi:cephalosporin hydroxylase
MRPQPVQVELTDSVRDYWIQRLIQHNGDSYCGIAMSKFPEDLRVYEHLLWDTRVDHVIEVGTDAGGSALWFRDRLRTLRAYGLIDKFRVISIDIDQSEASENLKAADPRYADDIVLIEADVCDPQLRQRIDPLVPPGARSIVVEDSAHIFETTTAALRSLSHLVPVGSYFVVEDGVVDVDALRAVDGWPRGVTPAINAWLESSEGQSFEPCRDLECYGLTCHPQGFLRRVRPVGTS